MINLQKIVTRILAEVEGYDRHRIAEDVGVNYTTVCRWANGESTVTRQEYAQRLTDLWLRLCEQGWISNKNEDNQEYVVGEGETLDISGTDHVTIKNYGMVRINVHNHYREG